MRWRVNTTAGRVVLPSLVTEARCAHEEGALQNNGLGSFWYLQSELARNLL